MRSTGHGFCGIGRKRLLNILQDALRRTGCEAWCLRPTSATTRSGAQSTPTW
jgi:hypothetical protein